MAMWNKWLGGLISGGKKALGLGSVNLFPGDVAQATLGQPASSVYQGSTGGQTPGVEYTPGRYRTPSTGGTVQGTTAPTGGGGGGGGPAPQGGGGPPMEGQPGQPSEQDLMAQMQARIQPALDALAQEEQRATSLSGEIQASLGQGAEAQRGTIQTGLAGAQTTAERGKRESQAAGESAISQARRGFSEIQQGLMSRFGGGVSTGLGAISHLGGETMRNIATVQTGLQESMTRINETYANIEAGATQSLKEVDAWLSTQKTTAKGELNSILSSIGREKGALQSQKATWVQEALDRYQDTVNAVNQRNTQFKQDIYKMTEDAKLQAQNTAQKIAAQANQIKPFSIQPGEQQFRPGEAPFDEGQVPAGTTMLPGDKGFWLTRPDEEDEISNPFATGGSGG